MTSKRNSTKQPETIKPVVTDNQHNERKSRLMALGVPSAVASDFPLTPHEPTRRWCKKLKTPHGPKIFYFGPLDNWQTALEKYNAEKADLIAGRAPESRNTDGLRLLDLMNRFLHFKRGLVDCGELTLRSWYDYQQTGQRIIDVFGKGRLVENLTPLDFERLQADYGRTWGAVRIGNEIYRARIMFRYAFESGLTNTPVRFGPSFKRPARKTLRKLKAKQRLEYGARMFNCDELRTILNACPQPLKAMVLLGINGGLHNMDVATLNFAAMDLECGWLEFPRGKTGIPRRIPLWPETIAAIKEWLAIRPEPKSADDAQLVFLTKTQRPWHRLGRFTTNDKGDTVAKGFNQPVSQAFRVVLDNLGINGKRNFLALRHGFRTIGRGAKDREAVDSIMGHVDESMAGHYLEDGLPDERLKAVTSFVRDRLFVKLDIGDGTAGTIIGFRESEELSTIARRVTRGVES